MFPLWSNRAPEPRFVHREPRRTMETTLCVYLHDRSPRGVPPEPEAIALSDIQHHFEHTVSEIIVVVDSRGPFSPSRATSTRTLCLGKNSKNACQQGWGITTGHQPLLAVSFVSTWTNSMPPQKATTAAAVETPQMPSCSRSETNTMKRIPSEKGTPTTTRDATEPLSHPITATIITFAGPMTPFVHFTGAGAVGVVVRIPVILGGRRKKRRRKYHRERSNAVL